MKQIVKKLEKKKKSRPHGLRRLYKVGRSRRVESSEESLGDQEDASKQGRKMANIDADAEVTLIDETQGRNDDNLMFDTGVLDEQEVEVEKTLIEIKDAKPKVKGVMIQEPTELEEEERFAKQREEDANIFEWDDVQAMMNAHYELAARLQAEEKGELTVEEKSKMFVELIDKRKKHFARLRAEEQRRKPPTKAPKKNQMLVKGSKDRAKGSDVRAEGSNKRPGKELEQESFKKQKMDKVQETDNMDYDQEVAKMKELIKIVPEDVDDIAIDAIPLATKPPSIFDWKIYKEDKKSYYQIIRADGSSKMYQLFNAMLRSFDREDLETLWKLVKARFKSTKPVEDLDLMLYWNLKIMFEPLTARDVWRNQLENKVLIGKLIDS
ncbi:hypothetical protein Tco_0665349 [Tanacetum coccineum]